MANLLIYSPQTGIIASSDVTDGFIDVTSIKKMATYAVNNMGQSWINDWKCIRTAIKNLAIALTGNADIQSWNRLEWDTFDEEEKIILAKFMPNKINGLYLFELESQGLIAVADCAEYFDSNSRSARKQRWTSCRKVVMTSFAVYDSMGWIQKNVKSFVNADWPNGINLSDAYIDGYEFKQDDYLYGLGDFVHNELRNSGLIPTNGLTLNELCDYLLDILLNGNY